MSTQQDFPPLDPVNPDYYIGGNGIESIRVIEAFVADKPYRWAPLKYLFRAGKKPGQDEVQDLRKAIWWIEREIAVIEQNKAMAAVDRVAGRDLNTRRNFGGYDPFMDDPA